MIRVRTKSIELMTTEIAAWESELKSKETDTSAEVPKITTTTTETATTSNETVTNNSTNTNNTTSATNTPKKQKLVHFNKT